MLRQHSAIAADVGSISTIQARSQHLVDIIIHTQNMSMNYNKSNMIGPNDFEDELYPPTYRSLERQQNQSYPPLDALPEFSVPTPPTRLSSSRRRSPLSPIEPSLALPARRQTTSSGTSQPYATSSTHQPRQWYGPLQTNMDVGYGPVQAFPTGMRDQSPPDSKPNVTASAKSVKHKRGYQACEQCRQRKTGCQLTLGNDKACS